jgi:hypothetical protein
MRGGRYRTVKDNGRLGPMVSRDSIVGQLRDLADDSKARLGGLARDAAEGRIQPADFQAAMQAELKSLHTANVALARGGWDKVTAADWGRTGGTLKSEYRYLADFTREVASGTVTPDQASARAGQYAGKAYSRFWTEDARQKAGSGQYQEERWLDTRLPNECDDCDGLAKLGWVPIGALGRAPGDGSTACHGNCRCSIAYR